MAPIPEPAPYPVIGDGRSKVAAFLAKVRVWLSAFFLTSHTFVLLVLTLIIVGPIFWFTFTFVSLIGLSEEAKSAVADEALLQTSMFFLVKATNFSQAWTILTPVLFAVSAGSSLETGVKPISVTLFVVFFLGFICSEFVANYLSIDPVFANQITNSATSRGITLEPAKFATYATDVGKMCIASVAITLGISLARTN